MSVPRKRGKVKKKLSAAKKVVKKAASRSKKSKAKSKPKTPTKKKTRKKAKRPLSVNTKPQRPRNQPPPKKKPAPLKKPTKRKKKKAAIRRTPPKSVSGRRKRGKGLTLEQALQQPIVVEEVFLRSPAVQQQITDRIIEKGLAEMTRGMVRTPESVVLGNLIIAEQLGNFDVRAKELAVEYNMTLREIYELWLSPPTKDL